MLELKAAERKNLEIGYHEAFNCLNELTCELIEENNIEEIVEGGVESEEQLVEIAQIFNERYKMQNKTLFGETALLTTQLKTKGIPNFNCRFGAAVMTNILVKLNACRKTRMILLPQMKTVNPNAALGCLTELKNGDFYRIFFDVDSYHVSKVSPHYADIVVTYDIENPLSILEADLKMVD